LFKNGGKIIYPDKYDALIIGSGPNGLAAAITLAQAGLSVAIFEAKNTIGGGTRSGELTLPGFTHDICSAVHPLGIGSPFFQSLPLEKHGLQWIHPFIPLAHPFDDGMAAVLSKSIEATCKTLNGDASQYKKLIEPFVKNWDRLASDIFAPLHFPKHPILMTHFAYFALRSAHGLSSSLFKSKQAQAFFAGLSAHAIMPLTKPLTAAFGLILAILGHTVGWPFPQGGSQKIANALASFFLSLKGKIYTGVNVENLEDLPSTRVILCDLSPKQFLKIGKKHLPLKYYSQLEKYRYGPGVFKIDWALNAPIPWKAKECLQAGTIHIGGNFEEIVESEKKVWENKYTKKPYIILAQPSLFDPSRAPPTYHTAWGYCHVPNGSDRDMTEEIENQIERFAPNFKDCILARSTRTAKEMENYNPNYVGGDINGGVQDIYQLFTRPSKQLIPYSTPLKGVYLCSSSTPPGGGVHGMCGYYAALIALKQIFKIII
jgi:phytoene dehydrogenase-like protein